MISLLWLVFFVQLGIYVVNLVGANGLNEVAWQLSARLPLNSSKDAKEQLALRKEVLRLKREMNAISAQDDFAKWARLRREHDKVLAKYDQKAAEVSGHRGSFDTKMNAARWILTIGLRSFLQFWHSKTPVFTYPRGWLPWPIEWILCFPRCPYGSVSINIWTTVCGVVIALVGDAIVASMPERQSQAEKVPVPADKKAS